VRTCTERHGWDSLQPTDGATMARDAPVLIAGACGQVLLC
jgi:hypothetical protein